MIKNTHKTLNFLWLLTSVFIATLNAALFVRVKVIFIVTFYNYHIKCNKKWYSGLTGGVPAVKRSGTKTHMEGRHYCGYSKQTKIPKKSQKKWQKCCSRGLIPQPLDHRQKVVNHWSAAWSAAWSVCCVIGLVICCEFDPSKLCLV